MTEDFQKTDTASGRFVHLRRPRRHDAPIEGETNVEHATHCLRCQDDARDGPLHFRRDTRSS